MGTTSFKLNFPAGVVSWYCTAQAANAQSMQIKDPKGQLIVDTKIKGQLSNFSVGSFASGGGDYTVLFPGCVDVKEDRASIDDGQGNLIVTTEQYAGEDAGDKDYNDVFATITWYKKSG